MEKLQQQNFAFFGNEKDQGDGDRQERRREEDEATSPGISPADEPIPGRPRFERRVSSIPPASEKGSISLPAERLNPDHTRPGDGPERKIGTVLLQPEETVRTTGGLFRASGPQAGPWDHVRDLEELRGKARECQACRLRSTCQRVVFGEGNPQAAILFVGEAPGAQEDEQGKPFVGAAGQLLSRIFDAVGLARDEVFITNTVMCRPPNNRLPQPDEVFACRPYLETKVRLLRPKIIVALGALATKSLIDPSQGITRIRGQWFEKDGIKLTATFHPAALLRDPGKKRPVWEDFKSLVEVYRRLR